MNSNLRWKAIFVAAVILLCIYGLVGLPDFPTSWTTVKQNLSQRIHLGLDLQGGTHLVLQVQVNEAVRQETNQRVAQLYGLLRDKNIASDQPIAVSDTQIKVSNLAPDRIADFRSLVSDSLQDWDMAAAPGEVNGYLLNMKATVVSAIQQRTMDQSVTTIRRRIDQLGLREPVIEPYGQGENEIIVELAGEGDPTQAKTIIQAGGQLEIRLVEDLHPYASQAEALAAHNGILPPNTELLPGKNESAGGSSGDSSVWWLVSNHAEITGRDLRTARAQRSTERPPYYAVGFNLTTDAGRRFGPFTESHIGSLIATILDHRVAFSPATIQGRIDDSGQITGTFTEEEATDMALILEAGALPASITYLEERTVGPSLGADSIRHGVQASLTSLIVVLIFMVIYYRSAGVNAVIALLLNLLILLAALAYFSAVLTLPGIAGVILTIGMGVDSNVLIFERIREELRAGKSAVSAVDLGFKRAFLTIIDTHVTTVVSAIFLFLFGTGPIKGFAISLTIGLVANLFTSVYVSRMIFDWHLAKSTQQTELSI
jgi:preprotein translocase subunit SecD